MNLSINETFRPPPNVSVHGFHVSEYLDGLGFNFNFQIGDIQYAAQINISGDELIDIQDHIQRAIDKANESRVKAEQIKIMSSKPVAFR